MNLVKHVKVNGKPVATIVAISPNHFGVAVCCQKDHFNKKRGVEIATGRALCGSMFPIPNRQFTIEVQHEDESFVCRESLARIITDELNYMTRRASRYYK